ncbi:MAG: bifunctional phosphopantothenoylcysteine decarboxylase/phosphopantothenate--cysteine ligase CoaBC [Rickettsiales bacterium]|nr:bifunctional phosphopantothenoylcysteine decarboxylase/phosphopantothenate--cysteine ligase CoaBC [Rickettsiales bacterium]OUV54050.1 MAG: hypothetical protein CBC87_01855 [Rickettsiales bacterium TMED127]
MEQSIKKNILLIITGGIASYKSLDLIRLFIKNNYNLECVVTKNTFKFVSEISFNSLLGKKIHKELFLLNAKNKMSHIDLSKSKDIVLVVPATANFIGKMANGIADDLASNLILSSKSPVFVAPAMNTNMWKNKAVSDNIKILKKRGIKILSPNYGKLACGDFGQGKLMEVNEIFENINNYFYLSETALKGKKAIVTSGPSVENIDPTRFLSNFSTGIQGYEIAKALSKAGVQTKLISGPTNISIPEGVDFVRVKTGNEFYKEVSKNLPSDIFISAAAISDWKVEKISSKKIKKKSELNLDLRENIDVLKTISNSRKKPKLVVGFAAETNNLLKNTLNKRANKKCDWMLGNLVSEKKGFGDSKNKIILIKNGKVIKWPTLSKSNIAKRLVKEISIFFKNE